ncbi:MAG: hypothetical protein ACYC8T_15455, partial [Myxococcaceae bacterium]
MKRTLLAVVLVSSVAFAAPIKTRRGVSGLLDVPDAEAMSAGRNGFSAELRLESAPGGPAGFAPSPLAVGVGLGLGLEVGLSLRQGGLPGDPRPSPLLLNGTLKLHLLDAAGWRPDLAVDVSLDRFNWAAVTEARLIASTPRLGRVRFAGFLGGEVHGPRPLSAGPSAGFAASVLMRTDTEAVLEAVASPRGLMAAGALRWNASARTGLFLGASYLPLEHAFLVSIGVGASSYEAPRIQKPVLPVEPPAPILAIETPRPEERPRFRLKMTPAAVGRGGAGRHQQYVQVAVAEAASAPAPSEGPFHFPTGAEVIAPASASPLPFVRRGDGSVTELALVQGVAIRYPLAGSVMRPLDGEALSELVSHASAANRELVFLTTASPDVSQLSEAARRTVEVVRAATRSGLRLDKARIQVSAPADAVPGIAVRALLVAASAGGEAPAGGARLSPEVQRPLPDGSALPA